MATASSPRLPDIKPKTPVAALDRSAWAQRTERFSVKEVAPVVGMSPVFIRRALGHGGDLSVDDVLLLLDQDAFSETFVPRSMVLPYLVSVAAESAPTPDVIEPQTFALIEGSVLDHLDRLPAGSVQCVVTSSPYWGVRVYKDATTVVWADGEECVYGHEQTPEAFVRHTVQILHHLHSRVSANGSVWWNLGDTYNTRTQIRSNAAETLQAMQGKDGRSWGDYDCRRYSAGHSYLKDGEQCMIPSQVAERASRIGYYVKSVISWVKTSSTPEPQNSRVSRGMEYILHLSTTRTPKFNKLAYRTTGPALGGRNIGWESDKLSDVWVLPTSSGRGGHGAQFPTALPGRCIALSTDVNDLVLDPFVGSGSSGVAARALGRRFVGIDVSPSYLATAEEAIAAVPESGFTAAAAPASAGTPQLLPMTGIA
ncbi:DNA-methyltransferase [Streptomyces sp. NPDC090109]|uniref:DNA-methyltransferase n=1 Tax=Streptomyces sp. NPDC090109 TaxID=3365948 RepID=UPI0037F18249